MLISACSWCSVVFTRPTITATSQAAAAPPQ
jgi:hypothetical protein